MLKKSGRRCHKDKNTERPFSWIVDMCSLYISPFGHDYVVNVQHRGDGAADIQRVFGKIDRRLGIKIRA